jgi:hypothetical protein
MTAGNYDLTIEQGPRLPEDLPLAASNGDLVHLTGTTAEVQA